VPELVIIEISAAELPYASDALLPVVFDPVESIFELSPALLFRQLCHGLRGRFRRLPNAPPREKKFVPPNPASFEKRHPAIPSPPLETLVALASLQSQLRNAENRNASAYSISAKPMTKVTKLL
jgi:hypothetical protein